MNKIKLATIATVSLGLAAGVTAPTYATWGDNHDQDKPLKHCIHRDEAKHCKKHSPNSPPAPAPQPEPESQPAPPAPAPTPTVPTPVQPVTTPAPAVDPVVTAPAVSWGK